MERGTVENVNEVRGMFAVRCEGGFAVFELVAWIDVKPGDVVEWKRRKSGRMTLQRTSPPTSSIPVCAQNWNCSNSVALVQIS